MPSKYDPHPIHARHAEPPGSRFNVRIPPEQVADIEARSLPGETRIQTIRRLLQFAIEATPVRRPSADKVAP